MNGAVAPIVPSDHSCPFNVSAIRWRSRSTAASSALVLDRPCRSKPTRKNSAASDVDRSHAVRASASAPRYKQRLTDSANVRARSRNRHSAASRSTAIASTRIEQTRITTSVTPPALIVSTNP